MIYFLDMMEDIWVNIGTQLFFIGTPWKEGNLTTLNILSSELLIITIYWMIFYHIRDLDKIQIKALLLSCMIASIISSFIRHLHYALLESVFETHVFWINSLADVIITFPFIFLSSWLADLIARRFLFPLKLLIFSLSLIIISVIIWAAWLLVLFSLWKPPVD